MIRPRLGAPIRTAIRQRDAAGAAARFDAFGSWKLRSQRCWYAKAADVQLHGPFNGAHQSSQVTLTGRYLFRFKFTRPVTVTLERPGGNLVSVGAEEAAQAFDFNNELVRITVTGNGLGTAEVVEFP